MNQMSRKELWKRIVAYEFERADDAHFFARKLAAENGWSLLFAARVVQEYKKFIYLVSLNRAELAPPAEIELAWELHSRNIESWTLFCRHVLVRDLRYRPLPPATSERYALTCRLYTEEFGFPPPEDVWPDDSAQSVSLLSWISPLRRLWAAPAQPVNA